MKKELSALQAGGQSFVLSEHLGIIRRLGDCLSSFLPICQGARVSPADRALGGPVNSELDHSHTTDIGPACLPLIVSLFNFYISSVRLLSPLYRLEKLRHRWVQQLVQGLSATKQ